MSNAFLATTKSNHYMHTRPTKLVAFILAAVFVTSGCSKTSPTPESTEAAGTIMAAKRSLNTAPTGTASVENTDSATVALDVAAAEDAAKEPTVDSAMKAKDAANASAGGPKNGDRGLDHNKW
jgi:hypothetical protein